MKTASCLLVINGSMNCALWFLQNGKHPYSDRSRPPSGTTINQSAIPAIIDQETYDKAAAIRFERAGKLGRLNRKKNVKHALPPTGFRMAAAEQHYEDPRLQAEYLYSLIESEVS